MAIEIIRANSASERDFISLCPLRFVNELLLKLLLRSGWVALARWMAGGKERADNSLGCWWKIEFIAYRRALSLFHNHWPFTRRFLFVCLFPLHHGDYREMCHGLGRLWERSAICFTTWQVYDALINRLWLSGRIDRTIYLFADLIHEPTPSCKTIFPQSSH